MAKKLTKKQKGFVKDYIETGVGVTSALNNYDTTDYDTANQIAMENLQKPIIQSAIQEALPDELLAQVHLEGLSASKKIISQGQVIGERPDYAVRHKYLDSAYKVKGTYAPEKKDITTQGEKLPSTDLDALAEIMAAQLKENKI